MFFEDVAFGEEDQWRCLDLFEHDEYEMMKGEFKDYDLWIQRHGEEKVYLEVKRDRRAITTGNLAIEFMCNNQPSGITATKADYWVHFVVSTNSYFLIPVSELRELLATGSFRECRGGDGYRAQMYLVPMSRLESYKDSY